MTLTQHPQRIDVAPQPDPAVETSFDFARYLLFLWRWLPLVIVVAVVCGTIAGLLARARPTVYEATTTLAVSGSKIAEQASSVAAVNYRPFIENNSVAATLVKEFQLDAAPFYLTPEALLAGVLSVEEVRNSNLIRLHVTLTDPVRAAKIANRVADLALEGARKLNQGEAVQARDDLRAAVDESRQEMEKAANRLQAFKSSAQVELTREDVNAMLQQRGLLLPLVVDIQAARARVARREAELAARQRVDSFVKSIDADPTLAGAVRDDRRVPASSIAGLQVTSQEANKVYQGIEEQLAQDRAELAALESRRAELIGVRGLDRRQQSRLTTLYQQEAELDRLTAEYEISQKSYKDIAARYDIAKVQIASRSGQFQVIDRAIVPTVPRPKHMARNALFGSIGGAMLAIIALVLTAAVRQTLDRARTA